MPSESRAEQAEQERRTVVLAQPLNALSGQLGASVEHALSKHVALTARLQLSATVDRDAFNSTWNITTRRFGVGLEPGVHFYLSGRAPEGFWVGPHLEASVYQHNSVDDVVTPEGPRTVRSRMRTLSYGGSAWAGYTAILAPGLTAQVGVGLAALFNAEDILSDSTLTGHSTSGLGGFPPNGWWLGPRMSVGLGWAF
ncbi:DUF3575 domain-containing protein [Archangium violaceum]|uniref:DUF3575 domain-containing protein n=1 Tax=Archangium violaceum TaxID=83451 RepID=UPI00194E73FA|nr:DUF3575 domain-containing protein [Archangium violaceum]QRN97999.1 DUF3575 domain-containing protein [Archangium violaceum]